MPGAEYTGRTEGHSNSVTRRYAVADGVTIRDGEFVKLVSGRITLAAAGDEILGTAIGGDTGNLDRAQSDTTTGNASGTVQMLVNVEKDARYIMKCSAAVTDAHVGGKYNLSGGANAQVLALGAAGTQFVVLEKAEGRRGRDNTYALVEYADLTQRG